jgi:DNA topoisomerase-1
MARQTERRPTADAPGENGAAEAAIAAKDAGLRYVSDSQPGIRRRRAGKSFAYRAPGEGPLTDKATLERIRTLAVPPAWTDVWICADPRGHLQATGRDARCRKQYRYHPRWRAVRDENKYERLLAFGAALPDIRARVEADLRRRGLPREKVLAAVVRLLETTLIRVGNEEYARANDSYGLTTLHDDHVLFERGAVVFRYRGKSGKRHTRRLHDRRMARIVRACRDIPGQELFQYLDGDGNPHDVTSGDVNDYLREISGEPFTAKDFRTWAGTVLAGMALRECEAADSDAAAKRDLRQAIERVAIVLGNTPTICRKCYVHPEIQAAYLDPALAETLRADIDRKLRGASGLRPEEAAILAFLRRRLDAPAKSAPRAVK